MLAYAIIAFEMAILYTVFWYVFLREPRPYRIQGNPWGGYTKPASSDNASNLIKGSNLIAERALQERELMASLGRASQAAANNRTAYNEQAIYEEWNLDVPMTPSQLVRSRQKGVYVADSTKADATGEQNKGNSTFAMQFLTKLSDRLNRINVKIP